MLYRTASTFKSHDPSMVYEIRGPRNGTGTRMASGNSIIPFVKDEKDFEDFTQIRWIIKSVYFPFWAIDVAPNYKEVINFKNGPFRFKIDEIAFFDGWAKTIRHPKETLYNFHLILPRKSSAFPSQEHHSHHAVINRWLILIIELEQV